MTAKYRHYTGSWEMGQSRVQNWTNKTLNSDKLNYMYLICTKLLSYALIQPQNFSLILSKCAFYFGLCNISSTLTVIKVFLTFHLIN